MASMATSSSLVQGAAMAAAAVPAAQAPGRKPFAIYSGLKASPLVLKQSAFTCPTVRTTWRPMRVNCATASETLEQCQKIVAEQLGVDLTTVKPDSKFSDLGADSLDTVEIVMALEEKFQIAVEQEGAEKIVTVKDAADVIHKLCVQKERAGTSA